jgi:hypothetical protein
MKMIKKITAKEMFGLVPYVIEKKQEFVDPFFYLEQYGNINQIHKLEQTAKGVYITLWICRTEVRVFLSNKDIDIEYED